MKKKLLVLAVAGIMTASVMTACGGKETTTTTAAETTTVAETVAETTTEAETETTTAAEAEATDEADKVITNFDEYISWTNKEWSEADDEEKLNAAIAYSVYTTEEVTALGGGTVDEETRAQIVAEMRQTTDVMNVVEQLNTTLPSFADMSLKAFADTAVEQIGSMMEAEAETEAKAE